MLETLQFLSETQAFRNGILWVTIAVVLCGMMQYFTYFYGIPFAWIEINKRSQRDDDHSHWEMLRSEAYLPITIIVPAYNEQNTIRESVMALLALHYPEVKVIVVNDGSSDNTVETMINEFNMNPVHYVRDDETITHKPIRQIYGSERYPDLLFIDKENGKKADAINTGITCIRTPLFCVIDADSLLESNALLKAVRPFLETSDNVIAVGGTVGIVNGCKVQNGQVVEYGLPKKFIPRVQVVEYIRAYLMARVATSSKDSFALISGAFGIFRRDIVVAIGGYDTTTVGEDMEMVLRMHRYMMDREIPYAVRYVPEPVCWTEAPETLKFLSNQRTRWQRGALECLERHKSMMFKRKYGRLGMISMPTYVLADLIGPIMEIVGYIMLVLFLLLGWLTLGFFLAANAFIFGVGVFITTMSICIEQDEIENLSTPKDLMTVLLTAFLENFGYRQICSFWRLRGLFQYFRGSKHVWGKMERVGFKTVEETQNA